ncbi:MAG: DUF1800 domain-containing protein, partial [Pseudomonadota bacterium]|nr:DUF1800 domain-containing protein [Pseudomonadota bacterium]
PAARGSSGLAANDLALVDRVSWGASASAAAAFNRTGRAGWLQSQLHPGVARLPAEAQTVIDALSISKTPFETLVVDMERVRIDSAAPARQSVDDAAKQAARQAYQQALTKVAREAASRSLLRALYSPNQLQEQMTWFWFNHFNVHQYKNNLRVMVGDYEDQALRPRALGRFRDLLIASATHPAMIRYLDNEQNAAGRINENYAREVMELHTFGVDGGYSQKDVQELARVLTGLGVNFSDKKPNLRPNLRDLYVRKGFTEFNPGRHDMGEKTVLGQSIAGTGWNEVLDELGRLARHPSTAHFVSRKLAQYFAADTPPPALVDRMTQAFSRSDGDIAITLAAMFDSPEFGATLGHKFKDPMHYVVSAVRLAYDDRPISNPAPMLGWLGRLGELPYNRQTPDGYPLDESAWASPGQMATRFEIARAIGTGSAGLFRPEGGVVDMPAFPRLASAFYYESVEPTLGTATRAALERATSPQEWNIFLLSSPEFMMR